jgi:hypothetical protein
MRYLFLTFALIFATNGWADTNAVDLAFLQQLPGQRAAALIKADPTDSDSTGVIYQKHDAYYQTLKGMIQTLRSRYYFHHEFPPDLTAALEKHAAVLTGIQYPLSATTGSSGYDALLVQNKITLAEDMICRMVDAIYTTEYWDIHAGKPSKQATQFYQVWLKHWNANKSA